MTTTTPVLSAQDVSHYRRYGYLLVRGLVDVEAIQRVKAIIYRLYRRAVPADEVSDFGYVRTTCTWRGEPFIVLGEHETWLRVEYTGGKAPVAKALGLEEFDFGVYQGWAPAAEVSNLSEYRA